MGSNGDGNASSANSEGVGLEAPVRKNMMNSGGGGKPVYPPDHKPGMEVPKGGSMCANCKFLGDDGQSCTEPNFIKWNGSPTLPAPADQYCSDWYMPQDMNPGGGFASIARPGTMGGMNPGSQPAGAGSNSPLQAPRTTLRSPGSVS